MKLDQNLCVACFIYFTCVLFISPWIDNAISHQTACTESESEFYESCQSITKRRRAYLQLCWQRNYTVHPNSRSIRPSTPGNLLYIGQQTTPECTCGYLGPSCSLMMKFTRRTLILYGLPTYRQPLKLQMKHYLNKKSITRSKWKMHIAVVLNSMIYTHILQSDMLLMVCSGIFSFTFRIHGTQQPCFYTVTFLVMSIVGWVNTAHGSN